MARGCSPLRRRANRDDLLLVRPAPRELAHAQAFDPARAHLLTDLAPRPGWSWLTDALRVSSAGRLADALGAVRVCRTPRHEDQRSAERYRSNRCSEIHTILLLVLAIASRSRCCGPFGLCLACDVPPVALLWALIAFVAEHRRCGGPAPLPRTELDQGRARLGDASPGLRSTWSNAIRRKPSTSRQIGCRAPVPPVRAHSSASIW